MAESIYLCRLEFPLSSLYPLERRDRGCGYCYTYSRGLLGTRLVWLNIRGNPVIKIQFFAHCGGTFMGKVPLIGIQKSIIHTSGTFAISTNFIPNPNNLIGLIKLL